MIQTTTNTMSNESGKRHLILDTDHDEDLPLRPHKVHKSVKHGKSRGRRSAKRGGRRRKMNLNSHNNNNNCETTVSSTKTQISTSRGGPSFLSSVGRIPSSVSPSANRFSLCRDYQMVLHVNEPGFKETRGTFILHQVFRELRSGELDNNRLCFDTALRDATRLIRGEFPCVQSSDCSSPLIECTAHVLSRGLVDEPDTHGFASDVKATYGVVVHPAAALEYYYHSAWKVRIPRGVAEQQSWVAQIERAFGGWQLANGGAARFANVEKVENLRLAIQFVKKWITTSDEAGLTKQMIIGHLRLIQKGWDDIRNSKQQFTMRAAPATNTTMTRPRFTVQKQVPHPLEKFQVLPLEKSDRIAYLKLARENYKEWRDTPVASQFRSNQLRAFEKLIHHTTEWIGYTDTEPKMTESTIQMFFSLLRERWTEFMQKTDEYVARVLQKDNDDDVEVAPSEDSCDSFDDLSVALVDSVVAIASHWANRAAIIKPNATTMEQVPKPPTMIQLRCDDVSSECSDVSTPFDKVLDPNPMRSDATLELFACVRDDSLARVQDAFTNGAIACGKDEFGETPLHVAASLGNLDILRHLFLWAADPWSRSEAGELPMHIACWYGQLPAAKLILERMGPAAKLVDMKDARGRTPFHHACLEGHEGVVHWFFELFSAAGTDFVGLRDHDNLSPWHYAKMNGHDDLAQWLAMAGADTSDDGFFHPTSLYDACSTGRADLAQWIVEKSVCTGCPGKKSDIDPTSYECARRGGIKTCI